MGLVDVSTGEPIHDNPMTAVIRIGMKLAKLNERLIAEALPWTPPPLAKKRVLLVGQAPSKTSDPHSPFRGRSGARLVAYSGLDSGKFWARVDAVNLLDYWPGRSRPKGDDFPRDEARKAAARLLDRLAGDRRYGLILLAGRKVAVAFDLDWLDWFQVTPPRVVNKEFESVPRFAVIPHPSGANHWWNQPANVELAQRKLREWI